jgi:hypothetical protein
VHFNRLLVLSSNGFVIYMPENPWTDNPISCKGQRQFHVITMTSTSQLAVGAKISKYQLKLSWLKFNHDTGFDVKIVLQNIDRPKAQYFSVCYSPAPKTGWKDDVGCRAHVKAIGLDSVSINLNHMCQGTDNNRRKRNYRTSDICTVLDILTVYQPAHAGNAKQITSMTKTTTGISLKNSQVHLAVKSCVAVKAVLTIPSRQTLGNTFGCQRY